MGKRKDISRRDKEGEGPRQEIQSKRRQEMGAPSQGIVNPSLTRLFRDTDRIKLYRERLWTREVLEYKCVNFNELVKMYESEHVDVANYITGHGWTDFVQVNRPVYKVLLRVLMSNLDETTMISWIGKTKIDLSVESWCNVFGLTNVTEEEEQPIMALSKEDLFFRLTGVRNLGISPFIRIKQLHQEADVRLSAQVVMNVLIPKKGSKEQIKLEEGRLLYAMVYGKQINLAKMIVERLRSVFARKTILICYGMHLMELMIRARVDLHCAGTDETIFHSVIDRHTLQRLGYKFRHGAWDFVGKGKDRVEDQADSDHPEDEEDSQQDHEDLPAPSTASPHPPRTRETSSSAATKSDLVHLQQFLFEQLQLSQATILSKLDTMDLRIKNLEEHLIFQPHPSPHHSPLHDPTDPKGKRPIHSPIQVSSHHSSSSQSHHSSPHHDATATATATSTHSSPSPSPTHYKFTPRPTPVISPSSFDSEATHSDPIIQPTHEPTPQPEIQSPSTHEPQPQSDPQPQSQPNPEPQPQANPTPQSQPQPDPITPSQPTSPTSSQAPTPQVLFTSPTSPSPSVSHTPSIYQRRKFAVTKPKSPPIEPS